MSEQWIPVRRRRNGTSPWPMARVLLIIGAGAVLCALPTPLFTIAGFDEISVELTDFGHLGVPGVPVLIAGVVLQLLLGICWNRPRTRGIRLSLTALAVADAFGILVTLAFGFALALSYSGFGRSDYPADWMHGNLTSDNQVHFHTGLVVLVLGLAAMTFGATGRWFTEPSGPDEDH